MSVIGSAKSSTHRVFERIKISQAGKKLTGASSRY